MSDGISGEMKDFIRKYIPSVSFLEVLLLLKSSGKGWSADQVSKEMRTNPSYARAQLEDLVTAKILVYEENEKFLFSPESENAQLVNKLEDLYIHRRYAIMNYIYSQPIDSIRDFANAFKIKKE